MSAGSQINKLLLNRIRPGIIICFNIADYLVVVKEAKLSEVVFRREFLKLFEHTRFGIV